MTGGGQRIRSLLEFALASLARRRGRTAGLLLAYAGLVAVVASVMLLSSALRAEAQRRLQDAPEVTVQRMVLGRHDLSPAGDLAAARAVRGVRSAEGRLWGYFYDTLAGTTVTIMVPPPGDTPPPGSTRLGPGIARRKLLRPGSRLVLVSPSGRTLSATVETVLPETSALVGDDLVLVSEVDFRAFFQLPDGVFTDLALAVKNPSEIDTVTLKLARALPESRILARRDLLAGYQASFDWREGFLLTPLLAAILAFALLAWDKASGLSAEEIRELGIQKAVGWDTGDLVGLKVIEGLAVSSLAFTGGYLAAWIHVFATGAGLLAPVLAGWSGLASPLHLHPSVEAGEILTLAFLTVVPYVAATAIPVWAAASTDPDTVLR